MAFFVICASLKQPGEFSLSTWKNPLRTPQRSAGLAFVGRHPRRFSLSCVSKSSGTEEESKPSGSRAARKLRWTVRSGNDGDMKTITSWISKRTRFPFLMDPKNFVVAFRDEDAELIGCAQIRRIPNIQAGDGGYVYTEFVKELSSIFVEDEYKKEGVETALINALIPTVTYPLFVVCEEGRTQFFEKFGFKPASPEDVPVSLQVGVFLRRLTSSVPTEGNLVLLILTDEKPKAPKSNYQKVEYRKR